jgi:hypothetical protein
VIVEKRIDYKQPNLRTIEDVQVALEKLNHDLSVEGLEQLINFNHTYLIITKNVKNAMKKNLFDHPEFLEQFDTVFADYYLRALRAYIRKTPAPPAWIFACDKAHKRQCSAFITMALGVNAHVNNDIAQVLRDTEPSDEVRRDYNLINSIIASSIDEVIDELSEETNRFGPRNMLLRPLYKIIMHILIIVWRTTAWNNYKKLTSAKISVSDIEMKAVRTARLLIHLPL